MSTGQTPRSKNILPPEDFKCIELDALIYTAEITAREGITERGAVEMIHAVVLRFLMQEAGYE